MFGRPKKLGVGKPNSAEESIAVKKALAKKYPDMVNKTGPWSRAKRQTAMGKIKAAQAGKDASLREALSPAELKKLGYK